MGAADNALCRQVVQVAPNCGNRRVKAFGEFLARRHLIGCEPLHDFFTPFRWQEIVCLGGIGIGQKEVLEFIGFGASYRQGEKTES